MDTKAATHLVAVFRRRSAADGHVRQLRRTAHAAHAHRPRRQPNVARSRHRRLSAFNETFYEF
jgi:hypothetical protein